MLLFYTTPIGSVDVKAEEVEYTQRQLQDVGAWFIGERLIEGAISDFDFSNLPTDLSAEDFLADLGAILAEGDPLPLLDDMTHAIDDIWNGLIEEYSSLSSDQAWDMVKDFFYTLWYDVPQSPSLPPLAHVFGIAGDLLEAADIDHLLQYANTDIHDTYLPEDYLWFQNINNLYYNEVDFFTITTFRDWTYSDVWYSLANSMPSYSYYLLNVENSSSYGHLPRSGNTPTYISTTSYLPKLSVYYDTSTNTASYSSSNRSIFLNGASNSIRIVPPFNGSFVDPNGYALVQQGYGDPEFRTSFEGINSALNWFYQHWFNIDFYVDNVLWVQGDIIPVNPIANTDLTYPNYEPAKYNYPDGTSVDWNRLYTIIYNAVHDGIVLDFGDLEDCFVDVNGQTAVATLGIVRNDYDILVQEQFTIVPYPRFNDNLWLTNLAEEMTEPAQNGVTIIENAYNIFPLPLQKALLFAGALLLFGLLIRRFLE